MFDNWLASKSGSSHSSTLCFYVSMTMYGRRPIVNTSVNKDHVQSN